MVDASRNSKPPVADRLPLLFFGFLIAVGVSNVGDSFRALSLDLWFYEESSDKESARLVLLLVTILPALVLAPLSGAAADRWDLRRTFLVTNLIRGILSLLLAGLASLGGPGGVAIAVVVGASIATIFFSSSAFVFVPRVVRKNLLPRANGVLESSSWAIAAVGPAVAAGAYGIWGPVPAFIIDGCSFFISAIIFAKVIKRTPAEPRENVRLVERVRSAGDEFRTLMTGIGPVARYLAGNRRALGVLIGSYGVTITAAVNSFSLIFLVAADLKLPAETFGFLLSLNGVVAVGASLLIGFLVREKHMRTVFHICLCALALAQVLMGAAPSIWLLGIGIAVSAFVNAPYNVSVVTLFQTTVSEEYLGRVEGIDSSLDNALRIIVLLAAAASVSAWGARPALVCSGIIAVILCVISWCLMRERSSSASPG